MKYFFPKKKYEAAELLQFLYWFTGFWCRFWPQDRSSGAGAGWKVVVSDLRGAGIIGGGSSVSGGKSPVISKISAEVYTFFHKNYFSLRKFPKKSINLGTYFGNHWRLPFRNRWTPPDNPRTPLESSPVTTRSQLSCGNGFRNCHSWPEIMSFEQFWSTWIFDNFGSENLELKSGCIRMTVLRDQTPQKPRPNRYGKRQNFLKVRKHSARCVQKFLKSPHPSGITCGKLFWGILIPEGCGDLDEIAG